MAMSLSERRRIEIEFWRDNEKERPGADSLDNQLDKSADALIFREAMRRYETTFAAASRIVELGGGQGWASCIVKRLFPKSHVTVTDISEFAVRSVTRWENIYGVHVDAIQVCTSDELPFDDESIDVAFCFAAAHHFVTHRETFRELQRVLRPGGTAYYVFEPSSPRWLYPIALRRVNKKRPEVPEDVLVPGHIARMAEETGLRCEVNYWPSTLKRSRGASVYFGILCHVPAICPFVPCTANFVFRKCDVP